MLIFDNSAAEPGFLADQAFLYQPVQGFLYDPLLQVHDWISTTLLIAGIGEGVE